MFLVFLFQGVLSYWNEPHETIAYIASLNLKEEHIAWIDKLFSIWPGEERNMISSAVWQDEVKSSHFSNMGVWHYYDQPYGVHGYKYNTNQFFDFFNVNHSVSDSMKAIMDPTTTSIWSLAFHLRSLIHFVGDAHTPMHAITGFSEVNTGGDAGGNFITNLGNIKSTWGGQPSGNLHKVWDSSMFRLQETGAYTNKKSEFIKNATSILEYGKSQNIPNQDDLTPMTWLNYAYQVAIMTYENLTLVDKGAKKYDGNLDNLKKLGETDGRKLIYLGGHRLGLILRKFFDERGLPEINIDKPATPLPIPTATQVPDENQDTGGDGKVKYPFGMELREIIAWGLDVIFLMINIIYTILVLKERKIHPDNIEQLEEKLNDEPEAEL